MKYFYECATCGNIVLFENFSGNVPTCCGSEMEPMVPGTSNGDKEKHVPSCLTEERKIKVCVGEELHPSTANHYIEWISLETNRGYYKKSIPVGCPPKVCFHLGKDEYPVAVYAFCNLHGLWAFNF